MPKGTSVHRKSLGCTRGSFLDQLQRPDVDSITGLQLRCASINVQEVPVRAARLLRNGDLRLLAFTDGTGRQSHVFSMWARDRSAIG